MRDRVLIIGGGVSGLFVASLIGDGVRVFEEHRVVGFPEHCTGIISTDTLRAMSLPKRLVESSYNQFVLYFPKGYRIVLKGSPLAVKVDRPGVELEFYYRALDRGARIDLGTRVNSLTSNGQVASNNNIYEGDLIVLAEGYKQYFSKRLGLVGKSRRIPAIQARIRGEVNVDFIEVYFSVLTPGYFSWLVPIGDSEAVIGLAADDRRLIDKLHLLLRILGKTNRISNYRIKRLYGGLVLRGPMGGLVKDKVVAIGDSVGMVKPLTGGGLYPISIAGTTLSKLIIKYVDGDISLDELRVRYVMEIKHMWKSLKITSQLLDLINYRVEDFLQIIARGLNRLGLKTIIDEVEYDDHLRNILYLLRPRNKVRFLGSIITGLI